MALPKKTRDRVLDRDQGVCVVRGPVCLGAAQVAHHRANRGAGGARSLDGASNLVASCSPCNGWIEDSTGADRADLITRGLRVEGASTHAKTADRARETPVTYPNGRVYLLDDDYGKEEVRGATI